MKPRKKRIVLTRYAKPADEDRQNAQGGEVIIHAVAGPGMHPLEAIVGEVHLRLDEFQIDPAVVKIELDIGGQNGAEHNPEVHQRRDVDRREQAIAVQA